MMKKYQWKLWDMKNRHSKDDIFDTLSKTEKCKRVIFIMKVLP